jgi:hypothetical protein
MTETYKIAYKALEDIKELLFHDIHAKECALCIVERALKEIEALEFEEYALDFVAPYYYRSNWDYGNLGGA